MQHRKIPKKFFLFIPYQKQLRGSFVNTHTWPEPKFQPKNRTENLRGIGTWAREFEINKLMQRFAYTYKVFENFSEQLPPKYYCTFQSFTHLPILLYFRGPNRLRISSAQANLQTAYFWGLN